jgi:hypothetical protein
MPLDLPVSLWAESIYGNGGTFTAPAVHLDFAHKANELVLNGDQLALHYLTKLTRAMAIHVNSVVNINAAAIRKRARGGHLSIKLMTQHLLSEAVQHQKDVSLQNVGIMGSTSGGIERPTVSFPCT